MNTTIKIIILDNLFKRRTSLPDLSIWPTVRPRTAKNINHIQETEIVANVNATFSEPK